MKIKLLSALLLAAVLVLPASTTLAQTDGRRQVIVKFRDGTSAADRRAAISRSGAQEVGGLMLHQTYVVAVNNSQSQRALAGDRRVEYVEADARATALVTPNDTHYGSLQWGFENTGQVIGGQTGRVDADIDADGAWDTALGAGVTVAILDTGIDQNHEDLSAKVIANRNFTSSSSADDFYGHGTHVGGITAAITDNGVGVAGGCPACQLLNVKVLGDDGGGNYSWIADGIVWAADNGVKVINLSLGGSIKSRTLERAVNYAWDRGVVLVAAAGNSGSSAKIYPAGYDRVMAVAATNNTDAKASFSNYGSRWVDIAAPGENIFSTFPNHPFTISQKYGRSQNYDFASGTSMATPMVAAAAALVWSTPHGSSASAVRSRVEATADNIAGTGKYWSAGRLNAQAAVTP
jgi:thermitase